MITGRTYFKFTASMLVFIVAFGAVFSSFPKLVRAEYALTLPNPMQLLKAESNWNCPRLLGLKLNSDNGLKLDFIFKKADARLSRESLAKESQRLLNYFLAALSFKNDNLWVNLSPRESDRIINDDLARTEFGQEMLIQDYLLKQLASSLTHPDTMLGQEYWSKHDFQEQKIWISPKRARLSEFKNGVFIDDATLKISYEDREAKLGDEYLASLEEQVNYSKHFSRLRQLYNSWLLAQWFKKKVKRTAWENYLNKQKIAGIDAANDKVKEKVYDSYMQSFSKGVYDLVKKDANSDKRRKYFSGGIVLNNKELEYTKTNSSALTEKYKNDLYIISSAISEAKEESSLALDEDLHKFRTKLLGYKIFSPIINYLRNIVAISLMGAIMVPTATFLVPRIPSGAGIIEMLLGILSIIVPGTLVGVSFVIWVDNHITGPLLDSVKSSKFTRAIIHGRDIDLHIVKNHKEMATPSAKMLRLIYVDVLKTVRSIIVRKEQGDKLLRNVERIGGASHLLINYNAVKIMNALGIKLEEYELGPLERMSISTMNKNLVTRTKGAKFEVSIKSSEERLELLEKIEMQIDRLESIGGRSSSSVHHNIQQIAVDIVKDRIKHLEKIVEQGFDKHDLSFLQGALMTISHELELKKITMDMVKILLEYSKVEKLYYQENDKNERTELEEKMEKIQRRIVDFADQSSSSALNGGIEFNEKSFDLEVTGLKSGNEIELAIDLKTVNGLVFDIEYINKISSPADLEAIYNVI